TPPKAPIEKLQDDMIRDVDESLRQEMLQELWDKYGSTFVTAVAGVILLTAVVSGWDSYKTSKNEAYTTALIDALDGGTPIANLESYIESHTGAHQVIASFELAGQYRTEGDLEKANALYKDISENKKASPLYRDLATLLYVATSTDDAEKGKLEQLFGDEDSPWRAQAGLEWALHLASTGSYDEALDVLKTVQGLETTPIGIRQKAESLTTLYNLKKG
ncbi:MAG: hypothetical protein ACPG05_01205, partial [Bdellovibrionales bacterium]